MGEGLDLGEKGIYDDVDVDNDNGDDNDDDAFYTDDISSRVSRISVSEARRMEAREQRPRGCYRITIPYYSQQLYHARRSDRHKELDRRLAPLSAPPNLDSHHVRGRSDVQLSRL